MGKITNVLNKIQESRDQHQEQKASDLLYVKDCLQAYSRKVVMVIVAIIIAVTIVAVCVSNEIYNLERSVNIEDKKFDNLTTFLSNSKSISENQLQDFNFRLKNETEGRRIQINKLALIDDVYYTNLIKYIHANTFQINYLDKYTQDLKIEMEKKFASESQAKDLSSPPAGN